MLLVSLHQASVFALRARVPRGHPSAGLQDRWGVEGEQRLPVESSSSFLVLGDTHGTLCVEDGTRRCLGTAGPRRRKAGQRGFIPTP